MTPPPARLNSTSGVAARIAAAAAIRDVLANKIPLDRRLEKLGACKLEPRDESLARAIALSAFRRLGAIRHVLAARMRGGMPRSSGLLEYLLIGAAAQILILDIPDHAAVATAIEAAKRDRHAKHFTGLINAVLRTIARQRQAILSDQDFIAHDMPEWLKARWTSAYGAAAARAMIAMQIIEPPIDLTCAADAAAWAERLGADMLSGGSLRLRERAAVESLAGFSEGAWQVQDFAASLPARLLPFEPGQRVLDLCSAPGGKTAQLIARGGVVTAIDRSAPRLNRLRANLSRLRMQAETLVADALEFTAEPFDAVLLDAPCSATGTIRRHPDAAWIKSASDIGKLAALQARLLNHAAGLVKPGGHIVYAVCSMEPEEGEHQTGAFLAAFPGFELSRIAASEIAGLGDLITPDGMLRSFPHSLARIEPAMAGMDGFFAARLRRIR